MHFHFFKIQNLFLIFFLILIEKDLKRVFSLWILWSHENNWARPIQKVPLFHLWVLFPSVSTFLFLPFSCYYFMIHCLSSCPNSWRLGIWQNSIKCSFVAAGDFACRITWNLCSDRSGGFSWACTFPASSPAARRGRQHAVAWRVWRNTVAKNRIWENTKESPGKGR